MKIHELKLSTEFCDAVLCGEKPFEIRKNDRGYQKGDRIKFIPIDNSTCLIQRHAIAQMEYEITYVLSGWKIKEGYVALGIKPYNTEASE